MVVCRLNFLLVSALAVIAHNDVAATGTKSSKKHSNSEGMDTKRSKKKTRKKNKSYAFSDSTQEPTISDSQRNRLDASAIRFNKIPPLKDHDINSTFPLTSTDYPLSTQTASILRLETLADSVVVADDFQLYESNDITYWSEASGINPVYPGDADDKFWDELRHVVDVQIARRNGDDPSTLNRWPDIWGDKDTLEDIAEAVRNEYPALHQQTIIEKLYMDGLEMQRDLSPFRSVNDFIGRQVRLACINAWSFEAVAPINFLMKWHFGFPRPEEIAWLIHMDSLAGVPDDLTDAIRSMDLKSPSDFTAYPNGSPLHPSFPAMHSAGSTCSFWVPAIAKVTPEQFCELLRVDYAVAYGRTIAGVHYPMDNLAGLNLGQRIVQEKLPKMLEMTYGYNADAVAKILEAMSFDWRTFDPDSCTIDGLSTLEFLIRAGRYEVSSTTALLLYRE